jgi:hypothetical protein
MSSNPLNPRKRDLGDTNRDPATVGMPAEKDTTVPAAEIPSGQTPWQLYNEKAMIYDREMLKEWEDNLSLLLVFVSF